MKYPITVNGRTQHIGIQTACALLELWLEHKLELDEDEFEQLNDAIFELVSIARDERYRLNKSERPSEG